MITAQQLAAALRAAANSLDAAGAQTGSVTSTYVDPNAQAAAAMAAQQQAAAQAAAALAAASQQQQVVTAEQLTALIQPHIGNDAIKAALGNAMRAQGVANLPDAQPHQYAPLYTAFQGVLAQFGITGAGGLAPQVNTSII